MRDMVSESREEQDAVFKKFLAELPPALERFRARARRAGLPLGGVESLGPVGAWFLSEIPAPEHIEGYQLPVWLDPESHPRGEAGEGYEYELTRDQIALVDDTQAYFASVLQQAYPDAKWIIYRPRSKYDMNRGWPTLLLGRPNVPANTVGKLFIPAMRVVTNGPIGPDFLVKAFDYDLPPHLRANHTG
jgi:hypothetical protein